ncbi:hypothetical protein VTJ83DRAFT_7439 [Remersonia thermophila]|uniref:Uncharacterized protein n=1 Tax=Remersonia thermophila TaxID=72144 RepID=A0ABR4D5V2_9PEZI
MSADANDLLEAFRAAALSVTKLYKTSAQAQAKSRADGYQDCLEDLLAFLDKENIGLQQTGEGQRVRRWILERMDPGREATSPPLESEDEAERSDAHVPSSPQMQRAAMVPPSLPQRKDDVVMARDVSAPPVLATTTAAPAVEEVDIVVPTQETFTFQSSHPYPHDEALRLASLNLSDPQTTTSAPGTRTTTPRNGRHRNGRPTPTSSAGRTSLGRGAGQKRKVNLAEIFDLGSLEYGNGKDMFGGGKRSRIL